MKTVIAIFAAALIAACTTTAVECHGQQTICPTPDEGLGTGAAD